ncbi:membrane dipeptidase [Aliisedimentitalea scapharcae]|uniref:Membrane dipeptidase n=1 Tax=Aliisedimentitalea scapharcae TaxID=1524259 RepID=A0ABZ2XM70_9RHOB
MRRIGKWLGRLMAVILLLAGVFFAFAPGYVERSRNVVKPHDPYPISTSAQALHDSMVIGDWHADPLLWNRDLTQRGTRGQVDIPRLIEGNVALQVFTAVTKSPAGQNYDHNETDAMDNITLLAVGQLWPIRTWGSLLQRALYQAERLADFETRSGGTLRILRSRSDLETLLNDREQGQQVVGGILGTEGAHPLEGKIENLQTLEDAGYRLIGLHHFFDNALGGSLHGNGNTGLSDFGRDVVRQVVDRGLILDIAHSSPQVARDVLGMTDIPIVVSHTGVYSHCPVKRNYPDDLMRQIAATGGVIGIGYWADVTCDDSPAGIAKTIKTAISVVGEDHVSLGSDFDGSVATRFDTSELAALTQAMLDQGMSDTQIRKVAGQNMVRVLMARLK